MKVVLKNSKLEFKKKNPRIVILNNFVVNDWQLENVFFVDSVYNEDTNRSFPQIGDKIEVRISAATPFNTPAITMGMFIVQKGYNLVQRTETINDVGQTLDTEQTYTFTVTNREAGVGDAFIPTLRLLIKGTTTTPALTITMTKILED